MAKKRLIRGLELLAFILFVVVLFITEDYRSRVVELKSENARLEIDLEYAVNGRCPVAVEGPVTRPKHPEATLQTLSF